MNRPVISSSKKTLSQAQLEDAQRLKVAYLARKKSLAEQGIRFTQEDLAARCGWSGQSAVSQFMTGKTAISLEALISLSRELHVLPEDISPEMAARHGLTGLAPQASSFQNIEAAELGAHKVPVLSYVQAGSFEPCADRLGEGVYEYVTTDLDANSNAFAVWVQGNSMEPDFCEGDLIIVDPDAVPLPGDFVVAKNGSEEATFKKYRPRGYKEDGSEIFELVPLNEDYPKLSSETCAITIIGKVIEHRKFFKRRR